MYIRAAVNQVKTESYFVPVDFANRNTKDLELRFVVVIMQRSLTPPQVWPYVRKSVTLGVGQIRRELQPPIRTLYSYVDKY